MHTRCYFIFDQTVREKRRDLSTTPLPGTWSSSRRKTPFNRLINECRTNEVVPYSISLLIMGVSRSARMRKSLRRRPIHIYDGLDMVPFAFVSICQHKSWCKNVVSHKFEFSRHFFFFFLKNDTRNKKTGWSVYCFFSSAESSWFKCRGWSWSVSASWSWQTLLNWTTSSEWLTDRSSLETGCFSPETCARTSTMTSVFASRGWSVQPLRVLISGFVAWGMAKPEFAATTCPAACLRSTTGQIWTSFLG